MNKNISCFNYLYLLVIILIIALFIFPLINLNGHIQKTEPSTVISLINEGKVEKIYAYNGEAEVLLKSENSELDAKKRERFPAYADYYFEYTEVSWNKILSAIEDYNAGKTEAELVKWENPPVRASWFERLLPFLD